MGQLGAVAMASIACRTLASFPAARACDHCLSQVQATAPVTSAPSW